MAVGIPIFLYLLLWLGPVHEKIRVIAREQLSELLGAEVGINHLRVLPFTRVELGGISIVSRGDTLLTAGELNAGVSGRNLLRGRIVVTNVELMSPSVNITRDSAGAPLNLQPVIDRLKGDGSNPPKAFNLAVHTVVVRNGRAKYTVKTAPRKAAGRFDANHIAVDSINADLTAPRVSNGNFYVSLKRFTAREQSGPEIRRLAADVMLADSLLSISGLDLRLNASQLRFATMELNLRGRHIGGIELLRGSELSGYDFRAFDQAIGEVPSPVRLEARAELWRDSLSISNLAISTPGNELNVRLAGRASAAMAKADPLTLGAEGDAIARTLSLFVPLKSNAANLLSSLGTIRFSGGASWHTPRDAKVTGLLTTAAGGVDLDARLQGRRLAGNLEAYDVDLGALVPGKQLGSADFRGRFDLAEHSGSAELAVERVGWKQHDFRNIDVTLGYAGREYEGAMSINDSLARAVAEVKLNLAPENFRADVDAEILAFYPEAVGLLPKYANHCLSATLNAGFKGDSPLHPTGRLAISDMRFLDSEGRGLIEAPIVLESDFESPTQSVSLKSDLLDLLVEGQIDIASLPATVNNMLAEAMPQYFMPQPVDSVAGDEFILTATIHDDAPLMAFVDAPVQLMLPATASGHVSHSAGTAGLSLSAPYLRKGNSLISGTMLGVELGRESMLKVHTAMPSKFGDMSVDVTAALSSGHGTASLEFAATDSENYGGRIDLAFKPLVEGADVNIRPGRVTFGGVEWNIEPAYVGVRNGSVVVHNFGLGRPGQELTINGVASPLADDRLVISLDNIDLDYLFDALQMAPTVRFGGLATGTVTASGLLGDEPVLQTDDLQAKRFKYGGCVMGDAAVKSRWNNETRAIEIQADVNDPAHGGSTRVDGEIYPLTSQLDFRFEANHTPVGFLHTFMSTWASKVGGTASGACHLYGDFKNVDLTGDFLAEDFALTIGFTNVTYHATDSVRIRPGVIDLNRITLADESGRKAQLNGRLTHNKFKDARFNFRVTDLDRMLVLNTVATDENDRWYGTIRANGTVEIKGVPGIVSISADAVTAPGSTFTFALTDAQSAVEYNFLTFRDVTGLNQPDTTALEPGSPELDRRMRARVAKEAELAAASNFDFDLQVDVTPDARINLIMDPTAGDKITAYGAGHVGVSYGSANDEMRLYGNYSIERGEYNFSLQDIILKTFTLRQGSQVAFNGDPMDAQLDISAIYQVNANLSDLDESFLNDKEVQRTNVPVYAVLNVSGRMQEPVINFDLDFPTLTSDVKRKVRSIVSTDEMMNRQIIYLLALNRFYTPEYMTATKGNDLMSVASGTISSQLSNILGQISDKISVAPSVRTESGDFSDVEVDVALSSNLLNNRLLLNGNFGYRDKALNNNQFIGDFDVEYLLTRRGNWRIKAYNHFNDRNLYVKNALTTQGLGLVFKHDFDHLFRRRSKK